MSGRIIAFINDTLASIEKLQETGEADRLELVNMLRRLLFILHGSVTRWIQWSLNYEVAVQFSAEELAEIVNEVTKVSSLWLKNDIATLEKMAEKKPEKEKPLERKPHEV